MQASSAGWVLVQRTVSEQQDAVIAILSVFVTMMKKEDTSSVPVQFSESAARVSGICRGMDCAGNHTVCNAHLNHITATNRESSIRIFLLLPVSCLCSFLLLQGLQPFRPFCRRFRVYENCLGNIKGAAASMILSFLPIRMISASSSFSIQPLPPVSFFIGLGRTITFLSAFAFAFIVLKKSTVLPPIFYKIFFYFSFIEQSDSFKRTYQTTLL